jgi:hypothetical protein
VREVYHHEALSTSRQPSLAYMKTVAYVQGAQSYTDSILSIIKLVR